MAAFFANLGPDALLVAAKQEFDHGLDVIQLAEAFDTTEANPRAAAALELTIHLEPNIRRTVST